MRALTTMTGVSAFALTALLAVAAATPAAAQQTIRGQGATLPAGLYLNWFDPSPRAGFSYSYNAPYTFGDSTVPANTGSSAGKGAFESHTINNGNPLPAGAPQSFTQDYQFSGSDAILVATDLDNYNSARWGDAIQLPAVGTPVTIAYNRSGLTRRRVGPTGVVKADGTQGQTNILYLSRASYCGIFTGQITNWNHPLITRDNGGTVSTQPITVVVRSDGSGTTEIFSRHLDVVCNGSSSAGGYSFPPTPTGGAQGRPVGRTTVDWASLILPSSRLIAAAGSAGVSQAISANRYSIGYVSPDFTNIVAEPAPGAGNPLPAPANLQNQADINAGVNNNYTHSPSYVNVQTAQASIASPLVTDSALVWGTKLNIDDPRANNPTAAGAYPINGFTFFDFYTCYPSTKTIGVRALVQYFTTISTAAGSADVESRAAGFAPLSRALKIRIRDRAFATGTSVRGMSSGPISGYCSL